MVEMESDPPELRMETNQFLEAGAGMQDSSPFLREAG